MRKSLLIVLDESLVVHGLMAILLPNIKPLPSGSYRHTPQALKPKLLIVLNLLGFLGANLLALILPRLFQRNSRTNLPHQSTMDLSIRILGK